MTTALPNGWTKVNAVRGRSATGANATTMTSAATLRPSSPPRKFMVLTRRADRRPFPYLTPRDLDLVAALEVQHLGRIRAADRDLHHPRRPEHPERLMPLAAIVSAEIFDDRVMDTQAETLERHPRALDVGDHVAEVV